MDPTTGNESTPSTTADPAGPTANMPRTVTAPSGSQNANGLLSDEVGFPWDSGSPPKVDGFEVIKQIGAGGMGTIWQAIQRSTRRDVALKIMSSRSFGSSRGRARFDREIEITARLSHPNIARVFEGGFSDDIFYYAMELIDGVPLDRFAEGCKPNVRELAELMRRVCVGVAHAHQKGVIHRDLKPSNILVTVDGQPHVLDFGLAKAVYEVAASTQVTVEGEVAGTPSYMSPEQAAGRTDRLDTRSDVYSLGVILFNLLSGEFPHDVSGSFLDIMRRVAEEEPKKLRAVIPQADREMEAILGKALAKDPEDRYATAGDLADDLQRYLRLEPLLAQPPTLTYLFAKNLRRHRVPVAVAAMVLLLLLGTGIWSYIQISREKSTAIDAKLDADRQRAMAEDRRRDAEIQRRDADAARLKALTAQKQADQERTAAEASLADRLLSEADARSAEWHWEEARALVRQADPLFRKLGRSTIPIDLRLWQSYRLTPPPLVTLPRKQTHVIALSGDGRRAATGHLDGTIAIWDVPRSEVTGIVSLEKIPVPPNLAKMDPFAINGLAISADGKLLLAGSQDLRMALWDADKGTLLHKMPGHQNKIHAVAISADGSLGLSGGWGAEVHAWDLKTGKELWKYSYFKNGAHGVIAVAFTSDVKYAIVLYAGMGAIVYDARTGAKVVELPDTTQRGATCLATAPDPDLLAFGDNFGGLRVVSIKDHAIRNVFAGHQTAAARVAFSPDGSRLISSGQDGLIRVTELATGRLVRALPGLENQAQDLVVSRDGRFVAISNGEGVKIRTLTSPAADITTVLQVDGQPWISAAISHRGRLAAVADGRSMVVLDLMTGRVLVEVPYDITRGVWSSSRIPIQFIADDSAVVWGDDKQLGTLVLATGQTTLLPTGSLGPVVGMDRDAERILLNQYDKLLVADRHALHVSHAVPLYPKGESDIRGVRVADWLPGDQILLFTDATKYQKYPFLPRWTEYGAQRMSVYDARSDKLLRTLELRDCNITGVSLSPDASQVLLATGAAAGIWDLDTMKLMLGLHLRGGGVVDCRWIHHGKTAITPDYLDDTLRFWDTRTGERLGTLDNAGMAPTAIDCTDDGRFLLLAGRGLRERHLSVARDLFRHREMEECEKRLAAITARKANSIETSPADPQRLALLGHWYALNGIHDWAGPLLENAATPNGKPSLELARSYWLGGQKEKAAAEFGWLAISNGTDQAYYRLCAAAARAGR